MSAMHLSTHLSTCQSLNLRLNEGTLQLLPVASQAFCAGVFENTAPDLRI